MEKVKKNIAIVAYTDGSARGGNATYASFYYAYEVNKEEPKSITFGNFKTPVTDKGIVSNGIKNTEAFYKNAVNVEPFIAFTLRAFKKNSTNNDMELLSILDVLKHILKTFKKTEEVEYKIKSILIKTDSKVSIARLNTIFNACNKNQDLSKNEIPYKNDIVEVYKTFTDMGCEIDLKHVYGHSGVEGNEFVDRLAISCYENTEEDFLSVTDITDMFITSKKSLELPWYLDINRVFIIGGDNPFLFLNKYDKSDTIGVKNGGTLVGLIKNKVLPEPIKTIYDKYREVCDTSVIDVRIQLTELREKENALLFNIAGKDAITPNKNNRWMSCCSKGGIVAGGTMGALGVKMFNELENLYTRIQDDDLITRVDIKEFCMKRKSDVENFKLNLNTFTKIADFIVDDNFKSKEHNVEIKIFFKASLPSSKFLNFMFLDANSKIELIIHSFNGVALNYAYYMESEKYDIKCLFTDAGNDYMYV